MSYKVTDTKTGYSTGKVYMSLKQARRAADKLDLTYGAYRYRAEPFKAYNGGEVTGFQGAIREEGVAS